MSHAFPAKSIPHTEYPFYSDYTYDIECYPNLFTLSAKHVVTGARYFFEISEWVNDSESLQSFIYWLSSNQCRMVGFNSLFYDYPLLHYVFHNLNKGITYTDIYNHSMIIIKGDGFSTSVWESDHVVKQVDLFKIHHFDNQAKMTSLKVLEINMRSKDVRDLPIEVGTILNYEQRYILNSYNVHDVDETEKFLLFSVPELKLRDEMSRKFNKSFTNYNDTKLGEEYFKLKLIEAGLNVKGRTYRNEIHLTDIIFSYVRFSRPEFNTVLSFLREQVITDTKGVKYPAAVIDGFSFDFGLGGIHGSVPSQIVRECDEYEIIDVDVTSFYPKLAIENKLFPAHLGVEFCQIYEEIFETRATYEKATMENKAFKLALNGAYGKSNSEYSVFYDPQFTMSITINGQLLLCMLAEWLMTIKSLTMIQVNTDGVTFKVKRTMRNSVLSICRQWETLTGLTLEDAYYKAMYIRDVNNYIAEYTNGKLKNKSAYAHSGLEWHKNHSALIVPLAVEEHLVRGGDVRQFIMNHRDEFDFMLKAKIPRSSKLVSRISTDWGNKCIVNEDIPLQNTTRYFISSSGGKLIKLMPPTKPQIDKWKTADHWIHETTNDYCIGKQKSGRYKFIPVSERLPEPPTREIGIETDYLVTECNNSDDFDWSKLNYEYYIKEAYKLIEPLTRG